MTKNAEKRNKFEIRIDVRKAPANVLMAVAAMSGLSEDVIRKLAASPHHDVRLEVAIRAQRLPKDVVERLVADSNAIVRRGMAERGELDERQRRLLAADSDPFVRGAVVKNPRISTDELRLMVRDDTHVVRKNIANHERTPKDALAELARDPRFDVRRAVAERKRLSEELVRELAKDEEAEIRAQIAERPRLRDAVIRKMIERPGESTRTLSILAGRRGLPKDVVDKLANSSNSTVRTAIAGNRNHAEDFSRKAIDGLLGTPDGFACDVTDALTRNPNAPLFAMLLVRLDERGAFVSNQRAQTRIAEASAHERMRAAEEILNGRPELAERVERILNP